MRASRLIVLLLLLLALPPAGCLSLRREPPRPGSTELGAKEIVLPAQLLDNILVVEAKWDKYGPYHFLVDTGSAVTLVTPELAQRYLAADQPLPDAPRVEVQSSDGRTTVLSATLLRRIELGRARFNNVPAYVYDCSQLTEKMGIRIDGVLGFPLFRSIHLTLDYPRRRVVLRSPELAGPPPGGATLSFNNSSKTPIIPIRLGDRTFSALVDSGRDEALSLNPLGLAPKFASGPTEGPTIATVAGDRTEQVGRLADTLFLGDTPVPRPVVEVTDDLSALGGGILKYFTITFDQGHDKVTFLREGAEPIAIPGLRSTGISFRKYPAYWRVVGIIPGSPADGAEVEPGDLVARINGEPVSKWGVSRYEQLTATADSVTFTFLLGTRESDKRLRVADLVP
jgi:hypothetical protein